MENSSKPTQPHLIPPDDLFKVKCTNCAAIFFIRRDQWTLIPGQPFDMSCPFCDQEKTVVIEPDEPAQTSNA